MECAKNTQITSTPSTITAASFYLLLSILQLWPTAAAVRTMCHSRERERMCHPREREDVPPQRKSGCATPRKERMCHPRERERMCHPREREDEPPQRKRGCATPRKERMCHPQERERMCHPRQREGVTPPTERGDMSLWLIENNKPSTYSCNFTDASLIYVTGYNEYFSFRYSHNFELFRAN